MRVSIAVFSGNVEIFGGQRWLSPQEKIGRYTYDQTYNEELKPQKVANNDYYLHSCLYKRRTTSELLKIYDSL